MGFFTDSLYLMKLGRYLSAAELLESHLKDENLKQSSRSNVMAILGDCYLKLGDRREAGRWFELSAKTALQSDDLSQIEKEELALREFEEAMECYKKDDDIDGMGRLASLKLEIGSKRSAQAELAESEDRPS
jgi:tetratricopeptide (TPR) repeat protein